MNITIIKNKILGSLDPEIIERLQLRSLRLPSGHQIEDPGEPIDQLIFIEKGIGSMTTTYGDGFQVEMGLFGYESVMGASALIGTRRSIHKVYMRMSGYGFSCRIDTAISEFARFGRFHDVVLQYIQALLIQACQSAGCNAHHTVSQRLSRWLLLWDDRSDNPILPLTHEYPAGMLGSNRSTVSLAAEHLQNEGLIQYSRGKIVIRDRPGLEKYSCECYRIVMDHLDDDLEAVQS
ncbi:Crp/Fnr family transcriptional regulator [Granulicella sp. dw_53]|uniref:Crp/Fnr family transcriptional regulator n=1 Tax=Granulicella sp. dw_53 TaxID=2719792 RepID=UPI001BD6BA86|nr:Crp/Fnr family transcriptional regulator [Granulicella sp. dw_53]